MLKLSICDQMRHWLILFLSCGLGDIRHSLQGRLKSVSSSKGRGDGIRLTLRSNSGEWSFVTFISVTTLRLANCDKDV